MWPVPLVVAGVGGAAWSAARGEPGAAAVFLGVCVLVAGVNSPLVFPRSVGAEEARRRSAADGRAVVYWRPGCAYCLRLRLRLRLRLGRGARRLHWVDIWRDPAGAAVVREANGGDETVPTLFVAGRAYVNPDPGWVRGRI